MEQKVDNFGQDFLDKGLGVYQIAQGTTTEEMQALFFDKNALREPHYRLHQLNVRGKRYYYLINEDGTPRFFPSVTTMIRSVMPENVNLTEWKLSLGKEAAAAYTNERASYGTFIHAQLAELMINRYYDLDGVRDKLQKYAEREKLPYGFIEAHEDEAKADIKAFAKWMKDYDVRPIAVEVALYSEEMGIAGMLDLAANIRLYSREEEQKAMEKLEAEKEKAAGDEKKLAKVQEKVEKLKAEVAKRIYAIIDFKSGKKGFYDEYAIQLELYRRMWKEWFPDIEIAGIYNIAPKDWTKTVNKKVSYTFEEQTNNPVLCKVDALLTLFHLEPEESRKIVSITGAINLDSETEDNVRIYSLDELVMAHHGITKEPSEGGE